MKNRFNIFGTSSLVILWVYTAGSKVFDFQEFHHQLKLQHFGAQLTAFLIWAIPAIEITTPILLAITKTRVVGLYLSASLLLMFTGYVALILSGFYAQVPCSCGGVLKEMSWPEHLLFNLSFLLINIGTIGFIHHQERRSGKLATT